VGVVDGFGDISTRELFNQWLRGLTVLTEPGDRPLPERLALIAEVNDARTHVIDMPYPPTVEELNRLIEAMRDTDRLRSREHGAHALVTSLLLRWLSEATGQPQSDTINRLALTIEAMLPPDEPGTREDRPGDHS
jgi:hypothetical protein